MEQGEKMSDSSAGETVTSISGKSALVRQKGSDPEARNTRQRHHGFPQEKGQKQQLGYQQ